MENQKIIGQVCLNLRCPFHQKGYGRPCYANDHASMQAPIDPSICLACPSSRAPQKITKKLTSDFEVCNFCFDRYEPELAAAEAKKDKICPQCEKPFGLGFAGFCSEICFNARMDHFTKEKKTQ